MRTVRVVVVEPRPVARAGLMGVLGRCQGILPCLGVGRLEEVPVHPEPPDVLLVSEGAGIVGLRDRLRAWRARAPGTRVVLLATDGGNPGLPPELAADVHGVLVDPTPSRLERVVRTVCQGGYYFDGVVPAPLWRRVYGCGPPVELDEVEALLLRLVAEGYSNTEIAERLGRTVGATKALLKSLMRKLGTRNRTQAAVLAARWGLAE